jgi:hypothetical protein
MSEQGQIQPEPRPEQRVVALALQVEVFEPPAATPSLPEPGEGVRWVDSWVMDHQREQLRVAEHWSREARTVVVSLDDLAIDVALMAEQLADQIRDQLATRYGDTRHSGGRETVRGAYARIKAERGPAARDAAARIANQQGRQTDG